MCKLSVLFLVRILCCGQWSAPYVFKNVYILNRHRQGTNLVPRNFQITARRTGVNKIIHYWKHY